MATFDSNGAILIPASKSALMLCKRHEGEIVDVVIGEHSPKEHRFAFKYLDYLWRQFEDQYRDKEVFRAQVSLDIGHVNKYRVRLKVEYVQRLLEAAKKTGWVDLEYPASWSHKKADHEKFHGMVARLDEWGQDHVGIGIEEWKRKKSEYGEEP